MLSEDAIFKTAVCYWSTDDECYVVESPFFPAVIAAEKTPEKTLKVYKQMLNSAYEALLADKVHGFKRGRPAKNGVELHIQVQADTKNLIDELRKEIGLSQGEFIDLITFHYAKKAQPTPMQAELSLETTINELIDAVKTKQTFPSRNRKLKRA
jgi:predicted RNase H-like HicB family nuclease